MKFLNTRDKRLYYNFPKISHHGLSKRTSYFSIAITNAEGPCLKTWRKNCSPAQISEWTGGIKMKKISQVLPSTNPFSPSCSKIYVTTTREWSVTGNDIPHALPQEEGLPTEKGKGLPQKHWERRSQNRSCQPGQVQPAHVGAGHRELQEGGFQEKRHILTDYRMFLNEWREW